MALIRPIGRAIADDPTATRKVPQISGTIPNFGGSSSGFSAVPKRNSGTLTFASRKNEKLSALSTTMIPSVVSTVMTVQRTKPMVTAASQKARNREWPAQRSSPMGSAAQSGPVNDVEDKRASIPYSAFGGRDFASPPPESNFSSVARLAAISSAVGGSYFALTASLSTFSR